MKQYLIFAANACILEKQASYTTGGIFVHINLTAS